MNSNHKLNDQLLQIGRELYRIRHARNEKLACVARAVKISHSVISEIENGRYPSLSFNFLSKLTNYYNVTLHIGFSQ